MDRERLLDMERRLKPVRAVAMGVLGLALVISAPWLGWWTLVPLVFAAGLFHFADSRVDRFERPEYLIFAAWAGSELTIAASVAIAGGATQATIAWLALPVVTLSARFSLHGVLLGVSLAFALLLAVGFSVQSSAVMNDPTIVIAPAALIIGVAVLSTALMRSDVEHRGEAVIDALTGLLNRHALANRITELTQQSEITGQPVGVAVGDLDSFKGINDSLGHAAGDGVLKNISYELRTHLRAFDLAYRIGGDEFLILVPGATVEDTRQLAEELREIVEKTGGDQLNLTMSLGVSASTKGENFDYDAVFASADAAMYEAKHNGRNRVCVASGKVDAEANGVAEPFTAAFAD